MLTVYGTHGSPGASTTAIHLAAHWASTGREVLLIETDPVGGSLSHNLGIQFTPGLASFVASGLPVRGNHLVEHSQDVLFDILHVLPAPSSPAGARGIHDTLAQFVDDLREVSARDMAVIIDGGRVTADTAASKFTAAAAGVVVIGRASSQLSSLEPLKGAFALDDSDANRPVGLAVTVGKSPLEADEWREMCDLTYCGAIEMITDTASDLSVFLSRNKRKSRRWRSSLEAVADELYQYAFAPLSTPRLSAGAGAPAKPESGGGAADDPAPMAPAPHDQLPPAPDTASTDAAQPVVAAGAPPAAPDMASTDAARPVASPPAQAEGVAPGDGPTHFFPPSEFLPSIESPPDSSYYPPPAAAESHPHPQPQAPIESSYGHPQPQAPPEWPDTPIPPQAPAYDYPQPQAPAAPQAPAYDYPQHQAPAAPQAPAYDYPQHQPPAAPHDYPQPHTPAEPSYGHPPPQPPIESFYGHPQPHPPPEWSDAPIAPQAPVYGDPRPLPVAAAAPPAPPAPSGSFRDWAMRLHRLESLDRTAEMGSD